MNETTLYLALFSGDPEAGGTEVNYAGYSRQPWRWSLAVVGFDVRLVTNDEVKWPRVGEQCSPAYVAITDAPFAGRLLMSGRINVPSRGLRPGDQMTFPAGELKVHINEEQAKKGVLLPDARPRLSWWRRLFGGDQR